MLVLFTLLGSIIILALASYAGYLWWHVKKRERAAAQVGVKGRDNATDNIRALAAAMLDSDLNITEGSIRITVMLDYLYDCGNMPEVFLPLKQLHDNTLHMPRRKARQDVPVKRLRQLDNEREALEAKHKTAVLAAAETALNYTF